MSKERIIKALNGLGLTKDDADVYLFLATQGPHKIREIAFALNLLEGTIDRALKDVQSLSIVKASIDNPLEFVAVPFEDVIDLFIEVKKEQTKTMQEQKEELLANWKTMIKKNSINS